jgi:hypothetical protein
MLMMELLHMLDFARFISGEQVLPIKIYCDNKSGAELFKTLRTNHKVKHINMRTHVIRELIEAGIFDIHFEPTKYNVTSTKALTVLQFTALRNILMMLAMWYGRARRYTQP